MTRRAVGYVRVSTAQQGASGLGLEAQQAVVEALCATNGWELVSPLFVEVETGKRDDRPELAKALAKAKLVGAVLVVAKIDRLARNTRFLLTLIDSGADVVFCDLPALPAGAVGRFMLTQMAAVAELEAGLISERTKAALAAAKARGKRLGNPNGAAAFRRAGKGTKAALEAVSANAAERAEGLREAVRQLQAEGVTSLAGLAGALNDQGARSPRGGRWHPSSVRNLLARLAA
jgi:DNA invertase Pin-like site-specific DNA recombinase